MLYSSLSIFSLKKHILGESIKRVVAKGEQIVFFACSINLAISNLLRKRTERVGRIYYSQSANGKESTGDLPKILEPTTKDHD